MLKIELPPCEFFNEKDGSFIKNNGAILSLEHSLVSVSKWESKWCKPFLNSDKTPEESLDYIKCMTINQITDDLIYKQISQSNMEEIMKYIEAPMTASVFYEDSSTKRNREIITSELIYFWMINFQIPFECQKWHLNRLLALIRMCNIKNTPPKKMSHAQILARNKELNNKRRKELNTTG